jgi:hypothetical protein
MESVRDYMGFRLLGCGDSVVEESKGPEECLEFHWEEGVSCYLTGSQVKVRYPTLKEYLYYREKSWDLREEVVDEVIEFIESELRGIQEWGSFLSLRFLGEGS